MKKKCYHLFAWLGILFLSSCSAEDADIPSPNASYRNTAIDIAVQAYPQFFVNEHRSTNHRIEIGDVYASTAARTRSTSADTLFYVVNFTDNQGYAIVSPYTDDPLVGICDNGHYNPSEISDNPNFEFYIQSLRETLSASTINRFPPSTRYLDSWVDPKVQVRWGQRSPYGDYCPNGITGCANTAIAMMMSYFKYPSNIAMTTGDWDVHVVNLDWDQLCMHIQSPNVCLENDVYDVHETLAKLLRQVSFNSNSYYYHNESNPSRDYTSTDTTDAIACLRHFGYSCTNLMDWSYSDTPVNYLDGHYLLYVRGNDSATGNGHGWVVDGYKKYSYLSANPSEIYYHCNWGWNGMDNGYFSNGVFNVSDAYSYDSPYVESQRNFNSYIMYFAVTKN